MTEEKGELLAVDLLVDADDMPLPEEIPPKYMAMAKDKIAKELATAKRSRRQELIDKWTKFQNNPHWLAADLWCLEHPGAHRWKRQRSSSDLHEALRLMPLDVDSFDVGYTDVEKEYLDKRMAQYKADYADKEFNGSSDAIILRLTLGIEIQALQQQILAQQDTDGKDKIIDRVGKLTDELRKMHDALSASRKQRVTPPAKPLAVKPTKEDKPSTLSQITTEYENDPDRADRIQADFDERKEQFERKRQSRLEHRVVSDDDGADQSTDYFDEKAD